MLEQDKLTGQQLGIDPVSQEQMDQAWRHYRHGIPAQSDSERDLHREWAQLDGDVRQDVWEDQAAQRRLELDRDGEGEYEPGQVADGYDGQPDRESLILAAMLDDSEVAVSIGQIITGEMLADQEYRVLFGQLVQTPGWSREPIAQDTIDFLSGLPVQPSQAIGAARDLLANHVRWTLIDAENQHLLARREEPLLVDPGLQMPQPQQPGGVTISV